MATRLETLAAALPAALGDRIVSTTTALGEITIVVRPQDLIAVMTTLRDAPELRFEQLIDLAGVDYLAWGVGGTAEERMSRMRDLDVRVAADEPSPHAARFGVVYHLLSVTHNWRIRVRTYAEDDELPIVDTVIDVWPAANWLEREAFDLYGIVFTGHPDLRRILTDYGFIGHPFRKDFPLIGNVEVRYDPVKQRVVYEPVSIEPRTLVPRVIRHDNRYDPALIERPAGGAATG